MYVPIGAIAVFDRSVQERVCHPEGCQVLRMKFHFAALRAFLLQTPLAQRMRIPDLGSVSRLILRPCAAGRGHGR